MLYTFNQHNFVVISFTVKLVKSIRYESWVSKSIIRWWDVIKRLFLSQQQEHQNFFYGKNTVTPIDIIRKNAQYCSLIYRFFTTSHFSPLNKEYLCFCSKRITDR